MKYGEERILSFNYKKDLEIWENKAENNYKISIELPEFTCLCPRSGYPDFAKILIEYYPEDWVVELKAIKIYINSFRNRKISHEESINEIYSAIKEKINPKKIKVIGDFYPRGNVKTIITIDSEDDK